MAETDIDKRDGNKLWVLGGSARYKDRSYKVTGISDDGKAIELEDRGWVGTNHPDLETPEHPDTFAQRVEQAHQDRLGKPSAEATTAHRRTREAEQKSPTPPEQGAPRAEAPAAGVKPRAPEKDK